MRRSPRTATWEAHAGRGGPTWPSGLGDPPIPTVEDATLCPRKLAWCLRPDIGRHGATIRDERRPASGFTLHILQQRGTGYFRRAPDCADLFAAFLFFLEARHGVHARRAAPRTVDPRSTSCSSPPAPPSGRPALPPVRLAIGAAYIWFRARTQSLTAWPLQASHDRSLSRRLSVETQPPRKPARAAPMTIPAGRAGSSSRPVP